MLSLRLKSGDTCELRTGDDTSGKRKLAIAWEGLGPGMKDTIVQTSKILQEAYGFKLGDKIFITRSQPIDDAGRVTLRKLYAPLDDEGVRYWSKNIASTMSPAGEYLITSQKITASATHEFVVRDVGLHDSLIARVSPSTTFRIVNDGAPEHASSIDLRPIRLGGIEKQVTQMQELISDVCNPISKQHFGLYEPVQGILLYGAKGTGKTALIEALAESGWPSITYWKPGSQIRSSTEPHLVIVEPEYLLPNGNAASVITKELKALFQRIRGSSTMVVAETRHPNNVDETLRAGRKFAVEIELPIPSAHQRRDILVAMRGEDSLPGDDLLREMSERTHGFVGADLENLLRVTFFSASKAPPPYGAKEGEATPFTVQSADLETALQQIRPSALQEIFLETPNVRWTDIGGQHHIKRQLHNAIERPLKFAERMEKLRLKPKKGVLLYGPPGCSKTLLVRALATEAGLNFLAVKGAELISMYVGESERATREVFRKARAASPSIIFFDEIDAIASRGRSGSDLNVLTTLLNEMDGFEELRNVFVVAATNKPQQIDPALMRPGRFDNVVYIGPPDCEARKEILRKQLDGGLYESDAGLDTDIDEFGNWTEGFSGAEIVAICQTAGESAFDENRDTIHFEDIQTAVAHTPKSITHEMLEEFETWNAARMAR
jgi:AAA family ATPase